VMLMSMRNPLKVMKEGGPRKHMMEEIGAAFSAYGIITLAGSRIYTGLADTDEVVDEALNRFEDVLKLA
jgi:glutamate-1-semialdehyde 2,1-aminomutase